jgi:hypothetical protein
MPYKDQESFVYVENQLLYVTQEINLKLNPTEETSASIYLRNKGQLLQGDESSVNTGNGLLSVFQEGKATAYTYNYWGSPVSTTSAENSFGRIFFEPLGKTHSIPAGITSSLNGSSKPLNISNKWIYKLSGQGYSDWIYIGNNFNLSPGEGFTMKGVDGTNNQIVLYGVSNNPGNEQRYDFRGKPNSGTIYLNVKKEEVLLLGNPYPSAIDLNLFLIENINTTGIAYFWDSKAIDSHYLKEYEGGYGAYSPAVEGNGYVPPIFYKYDETGTPIDQSSARGSHYARRYSPIAQGFIVEGLRDGGISFKNKHRIYRKENIADSQFKSISTTTTTLENKESNSIRLHVEFENLYIRELLLAFNGGATKGIDRAKDAINLTPVNNDAGWLINSENLIIHVRPQNENDSIPLVISVESNTEAKIKLSNSENIESEIFLLDAEDGIYYDLRNQDVQFSLPPGKYVNRFFLTFHNSFDSTEEQGILKYNRYRIFQNNALHQTEIISPFSSSTQSVTIFDSTGRKVREFKIPQDQETFELSTTNLSKGIYVIKILSGDGTIISKKVIISNF